ncbi:MAG: acyl-CoA/acyl-ACP dehydrogenase [Thermoleophilia bacterium]|nr:acyl-CoA/acyl-ACP dehydrogenase [Thermoleophilia bacterium]
MNFAFNDEQREIQASAKRLMDESAKLDRVIELSRTAEGWDRADYARLAELGWTGLHIPEQYGGVGLTYVELIVVLEQMGMVLYPSPFFASVCLAANALIEGAAAVPLSDDNAALLAGIAAGEQTATLAYTEPGGRYRPPDVRLTARVEGGDYVLDGVKSYVIDGHTADAIVVVARTGEADGAIALLTVPGDAPGLTRTPAHTVDETRKLALLAFSGVRVPASAAIGEAGNAWQTLNTTMQLGGVALAAESLGAAQHCFDTALAYTKDRFQFGRPIASFQAVKHICADLLMAVEQSRSAAYYAGWAAAEQRDELAAVGPLAKAQVHDTFWEVARAGIQLHGGIGFTYEHEAHYYYRRATASRALLGDGDFNREMLLQGLGLAPAA